MSARVENNLIKRCQVRSGHSDRVDGERVVNPIEAHAGQFVATVHHSAGKTQAAVLGSMDEHVAQ